MGQQANLHQTGKLIRYEPVLSPWMMAYAEYLVSEITPPSRVMRRVKLAELSKRQVGVKHVYELEARKDFQKYVDALQKGPLERARANYISRLPKYADHYDRAVDNLAAAGEWKELAAATAPAIDRVYPKRTEGDTAIQVNVTLSPERLAGFADDYQPAVVEALPPGKEP